MGSTRIFYKALYARILLIHNPHTQQLSLETLVQLMGSSVTISVVGQRQAPRVTASTLATRPPALSTPRATASSIVPIKVRVAAGEQRRVDEAV